MKEFDAVVYFVFARVGCGDGKGFGGDVEGGDVGLGKADGESDCDGSGACADVGDLVGRVRLKVFQDCFDEVFGLRAWDEYRGRDLEEKSVELLLASDVLDGFVEQAAMEVFLIQGFLTRCEFAVGIGEEGDAGYLQGVGEKKFGVARGRVPKMRVYGELCGGSGECLAEIHWQDDVFVVSSIVRASDFRAGGRCRRGR